MMDLSRVASCLLLLLLTLGGCRSGEGKLGWVDRVSVSDPEQQGRPFADLGADGLQSRAVAALQQRAQLGSVPPGSKSPDGSEPWKARIDLTYVRTRPLPEEEGIGARAEVAVEITLTRKSERLVAGGRSHKDFVLGDPALRSEAFLEALDVALDSAAGEAASQLRAARRSDGELIAELRSADNRRREVAARILAERKSPAALPILLEQLAEGDRLEQLRVVGALVSIGDERAVPQLIEVSLGRDPSFMAQVAYAIGEIGGAEAESYLFTASTGHPDDTVRRAASEALTSLRQARERRASTRTAR